MNSIKKVRSFFELIKFEHSIFALPFAYLGLFLAEGGWPWPRLFFWVTVAMVSVRTGAMCLNRLIDEPIDRNNPRTQDRGPSIRFLTRPLLWRITFIAFAVFLFSALMLHPMCFKLAPIPIALIWVYPYFKKISWLSHFVLGIILGIAPYGAWLASRGSASWAPGLLMLAVTSWVSGFDMIYALQDIDFDRKHDLKSFPVEFGVERTLSAVRYLHAVTIAALFGVGMLLKMSLWYWAGWGIVVVLIAREHELVRRHGLKKLNEAFFGMNALVSAAIFIASAMDLTFRF